MEKLQDYSKYTQKIIDWVIATAPGILMAIAVLVIGLWAIRRFIRFVELAMTKAKLSDDIRPFLISMISILLKVVLIFVVLGIVGIETGAFIGVLAAAGFAVGMALQGSLGNFAAGILVLIFKPYRVGDWVNIHDKFGQVKSIQIFHTVILSPGRKTLVVPNGAVIDDIITNFSTEGFIRMELKVTMPYSEDFPKVKHIIMEAIKDIPNVLKDPSPEIGIESFDSHSIIVGVRPYVKPDYFWDVHFEAYRKIKAAFHEANIKVAYSEGVEMGSIGE